MTPSKASRIDGRTFFCSLFCAVVPFMPCSLCRRSAKAIPPYYQNNLTTPGADAPV